MFSTAPKPRLTPQGQNHDSNAQNESTATMQKEMDLQGIEPWTTPMLREYYTTKPQALNADELIDES